MNILFLGKRNNDASSGVEKKMCGQIEGFRKLGHQVWYLYTEKNRICLSDNKGNTEIILKYIQNRVSIYWAYEKAVQNVVKKYSSAFEICYIRKILCTPMHLRALSKIKGAGITIIEEIPTYPYDEELKRAKDIMSKIYLFVDKIFRRNFRKYVDKFVTFSDDKEIFGVKTIQINNGIDLESIKVRDLPEREVPLRMVTVSKMQFWHGYDRLLKGVAEYYKKEQTNRDVYVHMVGDGAMCQEWKKLSKELEIEDCVIFHGELSGWELDKIFSHCQIAVSSLGFHRLLLTKASPLKTREYIGRGIPVVYAGKDETIEPMPGFCYEVSGDEKPININELICFHQNLVSLGDIREQMRAYAQEKFTWDKQLQIVLEEI